jgi:hypothetical protein
MQDWIAAVGAVQSPQARSVKERKKEGQISILGFPKIG